MKIRSIFAGPVPDAPATDYSLAPDIVLALLDDGTARLLDLAGNFFAMSPIGAAMLEETLRAGEEVAANRISARFSASLTRVQSDLCHFLSGLEKQRLIGRNGKMRRPARGRLASLVLRPALGAARLLPGFSAAKAALLLILAHQCVRWFGWAATVAAWSRHFDHAPPCSNAVIEQAARAADDAVRTAAAGHLLHIECKERALACWSLLRSQGWPAQLVVGIDFFPFASHCWCELGSFVLTDFADRCERFTPVMRYA